MKQRTKEKRNQTLYSLKNRKRKKIRYKKKKQKMLRKKSEVLIVENVRLCKEYRTKKVKCK